VIRIAQRLAGSVGVEALPGLLDCELIKNEFVNFKQPLDKYCGVNARVAISVTIHNRFLTNRSNACTRTGFGKSLLAY
jgi:hypothetical protein